MRLRRSIIRQLLVMKHRIPAPWHRWASWCRRVILVISSSHRYKAILMSSLITACMIVLSVPVVPEKFLGIRSPEKVLDSFSNLQINSSLRSGEEGERVLPSPVISSKAHSVWKRYIPHKFWARARPHNKFRRKKHKVHANAVNQEKRNLV